MRRLALILALIIATPAVAGALWPTGSTGWRYAVTVPSGPGRQRYGYVDAEPRPPGGWLVTVICGEESTSDGRVLSRVVGHGTSTRGHYPGFGGNWDWDDGRQGGSFVVTQSLRDREALTCRANSPLQSAPGAALGRYQPGTDRVGEKGQPQGGSRPGT